MVNQELIEIQDLQGLPRKLNSRISLYPIKMKDALDFYECVPVLNLNKNDTDNIEVLRMSYLKFLILMFTQFQELKHLEDKLMKLLRLILRTDNIELRIKDNGKYFILVDGELEISEFDFKKLKTIVSEQNMIGLDDENINPEFKKKLKEAEEFMAKRAKKPASLKQRILSYQYEMKLPLDTIFELTLYQFNSGLETINHIKNADNIQQALYSGMVTFKDETKLPNWLSAIEKGDNPLVMDAEQLKKDMNNTFKK